MSTPVLRKPELYAPAKAAPDQPCRLKGGRCLCGHVFFPMQTYGCEDCGAYGDLLQAEDLRGTGTLVASALVHRHKGEGRQPPFIVASVRLDDGPVLRTLLDYPVDAPALAPGARLSAVLVATGEEEKGAAVLDLRFRPGSRTGEQQ